MRPLKPQERRSRADEGERWTFGNPEDVYARREAHDQRRLKRTCAGCRWLIMGPLKGEEVACEKQIRPLSLSLEQSRRCRIYAEKEAASKAANNDKCVHILLERTTHGRET